jgi:hypothetical protein
MGRVKYEENLGDDLMRVSANPIPYSKINVTAKSGFCWLQTFCASNLYIMISSSFFYLLSYVSTFFNNVPIFCYCAYWF